MFLIEIAATTTPTPSSTLIWVYVGASVGGGALVIIIIIVIVIWCVARNKKSGKSDFSEYWNCILSLSLFHNVDEEKEEPEAIQNQYDSLPTLRPAQPPQYKPSPAYNQGYGISIFKI